MPKNALFVSMFLSAVLMLGSANFAHAEAIYSSLNESQQKKLACKIAAEIKLSLQKSKLTYDQKISQINGIMKNEIEPWAPALGFSQPVIGTSKLLFSDSEYFTQNAFALSDPVKIENTPKQNWLAAYNYYATVMEIDFKNGKTDKYNLAADSSLLEELRIYLPLVEDYKWPNYIDAKGNLIRATLWCKKLSETSSHCYMIDTEFGDSNHPQHSQMLKEFQKMNRLASPLFVWLVQQPIHSISYTQLFEQAQAIYQDPFVSLGVITWMAMADAHAGSRARSGVISSRLIPVVYGKDLPGYNYHFWGYLLKSLVGNYYRYLMLSTVHEKMIQGDTPDWLVDRLGLSVGNQVLDCLN